MFDEITLNEQKEARFVLGFFLTVQLETLSECVSRFGFDLTFRTTGHDPWFDSIAKFQAHALREFSKRGGYAPALRRIYAFIRRAPY
ncbi:MAG: hypothetical protein J6P19_06150 [Acetobacter sp.]|nr:hypothetical protein [Acetobacter sp.]